MTANLKRWNPDGADGAAVALSGTPLANVITSGDGSLTYSAAEGFQRGNDIGVIVDSGTTDAAQANVLMSTAAAAAGEASCYIRPMRWHTAGTLTGVLPILDLRSATANLIRAAISNTGILTCQNAAGSAPGGALSGSLHQLVLGTRYRVNISAVPGASTTDGYGALRLFDDEGVLLFEGVVSAGNFGTTQPTTVRAGESSTTANGPTGLRMAISQLAVDTGTSVPTIPGVTKNTPPPTGTTTNYPRVMVAGVWR